MAVEPCTPPAAVLALLPAVGRPEEVEDGACGLCCPATRHVPGAPRLAKEPVHLWGFPQTPQTQPSWDIKVMDVFKFINTRLPVVTSLLASPQPNHLPSTSQSELCLCTSRSHLSLYGGEQDLWAGHTWPKVIPR